MWHNTDMLGCYFSIFYISIFSFFSFFLYCFLFCACYCPTHMNHICPRFQRKSLLRKVYFGKTILFDLDIIICINTTVACLYGYKYSVRSIFQLSFVKNQRRIAFVMLKNFINTFWGKETETVLGDITTLHQALDPTD